MRTKPGAGSKPVELPAWMWTVAFTKHRYVPGAWRAALQSLNTRLRSRPVRLPAGFSHSPRDSSKSAGKAELARQKRRLDRLAHAKARLPATWEALGYEFPTPVAVRLHLRRRDKGKFWLFLADSKGPLAYLERSADFAAGVVQHEYMVRNPKRSGEGKGLADRAMVNASVVYPAIGIHRVELTAGLSGGSAIWPRLGFCPSNVQAWAALRKVIQANYLKLPPPVEPSFALLHGRSLGSAIQAILADDDPAAIFEVVSLDDDSRVRHALGLQHPLSGLLLVGGHWRGHLDLQGLGGARLRDFAQGKGFSVPVV